MSIFIFVNHFQTSLGFVSHRSNGRGDNDICLKNLVSFFISHNANNEHLNTESDGFCPYPSPPIQNRTK
jgi:hypothetical protein